MTSDLYLDFIIHLDLKTKKIKIIKHPLNFITQWQPYDVLKTYVGPRVDKELESIFEQKPSFKFLDQVSYVEQLNKYFALKVAKQSSGIYVIAGWEVTSLCQEVESFKSKALLDPLTKLPNRLLFEDRLSQVITYNSRYKKGFCLLYMDLDGFKKVNDTYGHAVGDQLLIKVSEIFKTCLRQSDTLARIGGDEFVAILTDTSTMEGLEVLSNRLLSSLENPLDIEGNSCKIGVSLGACFYPTQASNASELIEKADSAVYHSKKNGKNRLTVFSSEIEYKTKENEKNAKLLKSITRALKEKEFELVYQLQYPLKQTKPSGLEAYIRWKNPELGLLYPDSFLEIAKTHGLMSLIGQWILEEALLDFTIFKKTKKGKDLQLILNVSKEELEDPSYLSRLEDCLESNGIKSSQVELELSRNCIHKIDPESKNKIKKLKEKGFFLLLENFDFNFNSIALAHELDIDLVKYSIEKQEDPQVLIKNSELRSYFINLLNQYGIKSKVSKIDCQKMADLAVNENAICIQGRLMSQEMTYEEVLKELSK